MLEIKDIDLNCNKYGVFVFIFTVHEEKILFLQKRVNPFFFKIDSAVKLYLLRVKMNEPFIECFPRISSFVKNQEPSLFVAEWNKEFLLQKSN